MDKKKPDHSLQETNSYASESSTDELPGMESDTLSLAAHNAKAVPGSAPQRIQNYVLEDVLGQGGMGTVYRARQVKPIKREVALKVIKLGRDSKKVIARFNAERQAMALMNHPYIAKVLDAGLTETDSPFFVMELIDGKPIVDFCDRHNLSIKARLQLFEKVCRGMEHAHQRGIIHRDLKPSNILVTTVEGEAIPKIIDFGLAKATENIEPIAQTELTELGQVLGTVQYMSPEQAELGILDLDTRTDVYSLGVILFELITGSTPLDTETAKTRSLLELLEYIRAQEPIRPSDRIRAENRSESLPKSKSALARSQSVIGELDWIVVKAIERDRQRRYGSATQLAEDIERFLNHEPILAKPPSVAYRLQKFGRRYRTPLIVLALLFAIMFFGTAFSTYWAFRANTLAIEANNAAIEANNAAKESRLQSLYSQAESALNKGRYRDAFQFSSTAIKEGGDWEFGYQLKRIGDEVLKKRRLLASIPVDNEPLWVRYISPGNIVYQVPSSTSTSEFEVVTYSISNRKSLARRSTKEPWKKAETCGSGQIVATVGNSIRLVDAMTLAELKRINLDSEPLKLKVSLDGQTLAVLQTNGIVGVYKCHSLSPVGEHKFSLNGNQQVLSISRNGSRVFLQTSFNDVQLWDLQNGKTKAVNGAIGQYITFAAGNDEIVGILVDRSSEEGFRIGRFSWENTNLLFRGYFRQVKGAIASFPLQSAEVFSGSSWNELEVALFLKERYSIFSAKDFLRGMSCRYSDLIPDRNGATSLLGHNLENGMISLYCGGNIFCLEVRRREGWDLNIAPTNEFDPQKTMAFDENRQLEIESNGEVKLRDSKGGLKKTLKLEVPPLDESRTWSPTSPTISLDGQYLAVLWQQAEYGSMRLKLSSSYSRRKISVYELNKNRGGQVVPMLGCFDLGHMEDNRKVSKAATSFAADGDVLVITSPSRASAVGLTTAILNVRNGEPIQHLESKCLPALSPSGKLLAIDSPDGIEIRSIDDGCVVDSVLVQGEINSLVFSPNNEELFIGVDRKKVVVFSTSALKIIREFESKITPLKLLPNSKCFVGIRYDGADEDGLAFGSLVLCKPGHGTRIEKLLPKFFQLDSWYLQLQGNKLYSPLGLLETTNESELSFQLSKALPSSPKWRNLHLDMLAVNSELMERANEVLQYAGDEHFGKLIRQLENDALSYGEPYLLPSISDCYARARDWPNALRVQRIANDQRLPIERYKRLMVLFKLQQYKEFRKLRSILLSDINEKIPNWEISIRSTCICLLPLDRDNQRGAEKLALQVKKSPVSNHRTHYGDLLYRMGRYLEWHESSNDLKVKRSQFLYVAAKFAKSPNAENRRSLEAQHERLAKRVAEFEDAGTLSLNWNNEIREYGHLWEAKRLLGLLDDQPDQ